MASNNRRGSTISSGGWKTLRAEMGEDLAHFDDSDSEDGDSGKPSLVLVNPERRQSTYPKQEVHRRKSKVFETVKKDLEARAKKERDEPRKRMMYVDKARNVNIGGRDLKTDVQIQRRREQLRGKQDAAEEKDYITFLQQGLYEMRSGSNEVALKYLNSAIKLGAVDEKLFIARSRCLIRLERPKEAKDDADRALDCNQLNTKAMIARAEALFNMGEFEKALVQYERGLRLRKCPAMVEGILKCRDTILSSIGGYEAALVQLVVEEETKKNSSAGASSSPSYPVADKTKNPFTNHNNQLLGKLNVDLGFLEGFIQIQAKQPFHAGYQKGLAKTAADTVKYLDKRKQFWRHVVEKKY